MTRGSNWEVEPGASVGPVTLGMTEVEVRRSMGAPLSTRERSGMTTLDYDIVTVMLLEDVVTMIVIEFGAPIEVAVGIKTGVSLAELQSKLRESLVYDEEEGLWRSAEVKGVWYEICRPAQDGEEPIDPPYVPEQYDISQPERAVVRRVFVQ